MTLRAKGREHLRGEVQSKVLEEMHDFVFWLAGRIVDICPGAVKQGLTFTTELVLAFVLKSVFRWVRVSLNVTSQQFMNEPAYF